MRGFHHLPGIPVVGLVHFPLQPNDTAAQSVQNAGLPLEFRVHLAVPFANQDAQAGGQNRGGIVRQSRRRKLAAPFIGPLRHIPGLAAHIPPDQPFLEATLTPGGEIRLIDRRSGEVVPEDGFHLGQGIEPIEQLGTSFRAVQAFVQLIADGAWKTGDFTIAGVHTVMGWDVFYSFIAWQYIKRAA